MASWQVLLQTPQAERSVELVSSAIGLTEGDTVTAEIWRGSVTQVADNSSVFLTTASPDAFGSAELAVGVVLASAGFLLDAAIGVSWFRRRR